MSKAPYGVIFDGPNKVYIGSPHGKRIVLSDEIKNLVLKIADKSGVYYEGDGGDKSSSGIFKIYKGSWDDIVAKETKGYPPEFLSPIFVNTAQNNQRKIYLDPKRTIFKSILNNQDKLSYFKDRKFDADTLIKFLRSISEPRYDFVKMAQGLANRSNLDAFLSAGERRMFPRNWDKYPYNAGKVMKKFEDARNQTVLSQKAGVFVMGAGHLIEIARLKKSLHMIGGDKADE